MGNFFSILSSLDANRRRRFVMLGLDAAGKTTIQMRITGSQYQRILIPTIGFNVETVQIGGTKFQIWDLGGQTSFRNLWQEQLKDPPDGVIFVVDSSDKERICEAKTELSKLLFQAHLRRCSLLVLANKQDLVGAMSPLQVAHQLDVFSKAGYVSRLQVLPVTGKTGEGLQEALEWLIASPRT